MRMAAGRPGLVAVSMLASAAIAGCGVGHAGSGPAAGVFLGDVRPIVHGSLTAGAVAGEETAFGLQLLGRICAAAPTTNAAVSPASAAQAIGMLEAGARGSTRRAVSRVLHLPDWSPALVAALHDQTAAVSRGAQIAVSNHLFEQRGVTPAKATLDDLRAGFRADLRTVDFARHNAEATAAINKTVNDDTHGLIGKLFDEPLDSSTTTVAADALYLHAKWQTPFEPALPAPFHTADGKTVNRPTMQGDALQAPMRSAAGWQSVTLPYQGRHLQAVALLPPPPAATCVAPSAGTLLALTTGPSQRTAGVELPSLHLSQTLDLTHTLAGLGLPLAGDYTGLGAAGAHISKIVQKVVMDVGEKGTTAAAATGAVTGTSAVVPRSLVRFDRPFLFLIEDTATKTPLFLTYIADSG